MDHASMLTLWVDETHWFPFTESEDANITGPGHQDPELFVRNVQLYDRLISMDDDVEKMPIESVSHRWVLLDIEKERLKQVPGGTLGAIPVTTIWNAR